MSFPASSAHLIRTLSSCKGYRHTHWKTGRVRRRPCDHLLPSEPDVKVSLHPAQAVRKPRVSGAGRDGFTRVTFTILTCSLPGLFPRGRTHG